jgi:Fe2+ or Zn2+ uptake regulation protein
MSKKANKQKDQPDTKTFICEWCGKWKDFTYEEVEKQKKTDPQITQEGFDYYISCSFCNGGFMFSQEDLAFRDLAADLFGD